MATPSYQPYGAGATFGYWQIPLNVDVGPDDLTNVDITKFFMVFRNTNTIPNIDTTGTGTFQVFTIYPAAVLYKPSPADVAGAFVGQVIVKAFFPPSNTSADEVVYDAIPFTITAS